MDVLLFIETAKALGAKFLSEAGQKAMSENIIIVGIVLYALRGHFKKIEAGLASVAKEVGGLRLSLTKVETSHSERIGKLEVDVQEIKRTITKE